VSRNKSVMATPPSITNESAHLSAGKKLMGPEPSGAQ
jgi:hypothetical protein